jgi:hypothetical protein
MILSSPTTHLLHQLTFGATTPKNLKEKKPNRERFHKITFRRHKISWALLVPRKFPPWDNINRPLLIIIIIMMCKTAI